MDFLHFQCSGIRCCDPHSGTQVLAMSMRCANCYYLVNFFSFSLARVQIKEPVLYLCIIYILNSKNILSCWTKKRKNILYCLFISSNEIIEKELH